MVMSMRLLLSFTISLAFALGATAKEAPGPVARTYSSLDLETLEYKERLLKTGVDIINSNKAKLGQQIAAVQNQTKVAIRKVPEQLPGVNGSYIANPEYPKNRDRLLSESAARIKQLQDDNDEEEQKITIYYRAQVAAIGRQKDSLTSQIQVGRGDALTAPTGGSRFVHNYVNYHGEVLPPAPPPDLHATALKLQAGKQAKTKNIHD